MSLKDLKTRFESPCPRMNRPQGRRPLALAAINEGTSRTEPAAIGGVTLQIVREWVVKFNAHDPAA